MTIAFFDFDKTLIAANSGQLWLKDQWSKRNITLAQMLQASYWLAKYHLGFTAFDKAIEKSLMFIAGEKQGAVAQETQVFFHTIIKSLYRPGALDALKKHRAQKQTTALLTSCFDGLSKLVQQDLNIDYCLCTNLEVDSDGTYTGSTIGPPCFGKNKVNYAQELCHKLGIPIESCTFYTDSASDIPLLDLVGQAVAVNPDPHLRAKAQIKKWPIVDWGKPAMFHYFS